MKKINLIIAGYGEQGRMIGEIVQQDSVYTLVGYVDDYDASHCLGNIEYLKTAYKENENFFVFIAVGKNSIRSKLFKTLTTWRLSFASIKHPSSQIENNVIIGKNVFIGPGTIISSRSIIHDGVYINSGCIIEHDNNIGRFSHLAPGVITGGKVHIGEKSFIGIGSRLADHITLGESVFIAAGSVVTKSVANKTILAGSPARMKNIAKEKITRYI